jgi:hypothetical protein
MEPVLYPTNSNTSNSFIINQFDRFLQNYIFQRIVINLFLLLGLFVGLTSFGFIIYYTFDIIMKT